MTALDWLALDTAWPVWLPLALVGAYAVARTFARWRAEWRHAASVIEDARAVGRMADAMDEARETAARRWVA